MIFNNPPKLPSASGVARYVQTDLFSWFKNLSSGLLRLNLLENFEAFRVSDLLIPAGETILITNALTVLPTSRLIVRQTGNGLVTDGTWDIKVLRLINNGAVDVTISVIFYI